MNLATWIQVACAVGQLVLAGLSLWAAWQIAWSERHRAERAQADARRDFLSAVLEIGRAAIIETDKGLKAKGEVNWRFRMADLFDALQPIRAAGPPEAELLVSVARLSRALAVPPELPVGPSPVERLMSQHLGTISMEVGRLERMQAPDRPPRTWWAPFSYLGGPPTPQEEALARASLAMPIGEDSPS